MKSQHNQTLGQCSAISVQIQSESSTGRATLHKIDELERKIRWLPRTLSDTSRQDDTAGQEPLTTTSLAPQEQTALVRSQPIKNSILKPQCHCPPGFTSRSGWYSKYLAFSSQMQSRHHPSCPLFKKTTREHRSEVLIRLPFYSRAAGYYVTVDISIGARGSALRRTLTCRRVLSNDNNPLFKILATSGDHQDFSSEYSAARLQMARKSLVHMIANGGIYPNDVDEGGTALLQVSLDAQATTQLLNAVFRSFLSLVPTFFLDEPYANSNSTS